MVAHVSINKWQFCWANSLPPPNVCPNNQIQVTRLMWQIPLCDVLVVSQATTSQFFLMSFWSYLPELSVLFMIFYDFYNMCLQTFPNLWKLLIIPKDHMIRFGHSNSPIAGIRFLYGLFDLSEWGPHGTRLRRLVILSLAYPTLLACLSITIYFYTEINICFVKMIWIV